MSEHHEFGPSAQPRLFQCPGSGVLSRSAPERENSALDVIRDEGQFLHNAVENQSIEGLTIEQTEMANGCLELLASIAPIKMWKFEERVEIKDGDQLLTFGTADAVFVEFDTATVIDWKFGYDPVDHCTENRQLKAYAAGVMLKYDVDFVRAYIFQPRLRAQSEHVWTRNELMCYISELKSLIERIEQPGLELCAGVECKYCPAQSICPEFQRSATALVETKNSEIVCPKEIGRRLSLAGLAIKWVDSVNHRAHTMLMQNVDIPGWYLQTRRGKRLATDPNAAYQSLVIDGPLSHDEFMELIELKIGKLEELYADKMKVADGQSKKASREWFNSQYWLERKSDSTVLAKKREHRKQESE